MKLKIGDVVLIKYYPNCNEIKGRVGKVTGYGGRSPYVVRLFGSPIDGYSDFVFDYEDLEKLSEDEALPYLI